MESEFKCKCQLIFASPDTLNHHKKICPHFNNSLIQNNIMTAALIQKQNQKIPVFSEASKHSINSNENFFRKIRRCIMDSNIITDANCSNYENVCSNEGCLDEYLLKCKKRLDCGHLCLGSIKDNCLNCLYENCPKYSNIFNQNAYSMCPICLTENFQNFSITQLPCKHYMHRKCFLKKLKLRWSTEDINFNFLKCPICNTIIEYELFKNFSKDSEILELIKESYSLLEKIRIITISITEEYKQNQPILTEKLSFYICEKCGNPFFSGFKECREELEVSEKPVRLCLECFDYTSIKGKTNCEIHGRKNIQYKCKFCCNLASHFCFGTTHFCEECHLQQLNGEYLSSKSQEELQKCPGNNSCSLGVEHPPNGEEFGLYCLLCIK